MGAAEPLRAGEHASTFRRAGVPGGGGFATARAMAAFYQMLLNGGSLNGTRHGVAAHDAVRHAQLHRRARSTSSMGMPMHRGLGPHLARH